MKAKLIKELLEGRNITVTNDAGEPMGTDYQYDATDPEYHERYDSEDGPEQRSTDYGKFENIDWQVVHEILVINTKLLQSNKTSDGDLEAVNVRNFVDYDGYLSEPELYQLEGFNLIYVDDSYPMIDDDKYLDFDTFKTAASKIWDKDVPIDRSCGNDKPEYLTCQ
jgi:hypothetical protein